MTSARPDVKNPDLRPEAVVVELGDRARRDLSTPGAGTCSCGAEVWRYRTSGRESLVRFDEYAGGNWRVDEADVAHPVKKGVGDLRLHVCGRRRHEEPIP